ncbi:MAG: tRNA-dihydrouridine synthase [Candidatus Kuenenbacteria bacterium]
MGLQPRIGNREPILAQYIPGGFINAVGLTNPGAEEFAKKLSCINIPQDKFLLVSIFGKDVLEFVHVTKILEKYADGFELNLSCPHTKGYGMQLGQDSQIVYEIVQAIAQITKKPIFAKLTPNAENIGNIAKSAISAGAYGIVAINTVGPGYHSIDRYPVLTNKVGGLSGIGIIPIGLKCIRDIRQAIGENVPIIGIGGIRTAKDVENYASVGANFFGIGSALVGMTEQEIKYYFSVLKKDLNSSGQTNNALALLKEVNMNYRKVRLDSIINSDCDFKIYKTNKKINAKAGQFVFVWLPDVGEKPFSIMDNSPLTLGILEKGEFTKKFNLLKKGDYFYIRGPYGKAPFVNNKEDVVLVGGGCGIAGLYYFAKSLSKTNKIITFLGARDKQHLPYLKKFKDFGKVYIATEDGSLGKKGLVIDLFNEVELKKQSYFFNCGPKIMVEAVLSLELKISNSEKIYSSVDYMTRCGVGICGSCADKKGRRTCVEGPFVNFCA